ncbi:MAG: bifunctional nuclease family protein [Prevotellaceae bacterium]|jgi:bifunctional DNase/RNase|nr:bifunctional nuclease family protein [Prevotellaceae bacterium]
MSDEHNLVPVYIRKIYATGDRRHFRIIELGEIDSNRVMSIVVGTFEADFIAAAMNTHLFKAPMPYNVMSEIFMLFNIVLREIVIFSVKDNVIYAKLILMQGTAVQEVVVRISDALALAAETKSPIFVEKHVIDRCFRILENKVQNTEIALNDMTGKELKESLNQAVETENYERAAQIRDEIARRAAEKEAINN